MTTSRKGSLADTTAPSLVIVEEGGDGGDNGWADDAGDYVGATKEEPEKPDVCDSEGDDRYIDQHIDDLRISPDDVILGDVVAEVRKRAVAAHRADKAPLLR